MDTDIITGQAIEGLEKYFRTLESTGYMKYSNVYSLLGLLLADDFLNTDLNAFITEEDYRIIDKFLYCLYGSNCLLPYSVYVSRVPQVGGTLPGHVHVLPRMDENKALRFTERNSIRYADDISS